MHASSAAVSPGRAPSARLATPHQEEEDRDQHVHCRRHPSAHTKPAAPAGAMAAAAFDHACGELPCLLWHAEQQAAQGANRKASASGRTGGRVGTAHPPLRRSRRFLRITAANCCVPLALLCMVGCLEGSCDRKLVVSACPGPGMVRSMCLGSRRHRRECQTGSEAGRSEPRLCHASWGPLLLPPQSLPHEHNPFPSNLEVCPQLLLAPPR